MQDDLRDRAPAADKKWWRCNTAEHVQAALSPTAIIYAIIHSHVPVHKQEFRCTSCSTRIAVHPSGRDCFLATSHEATAWYHQQLLVATEAAQHSNPVPIQAHCAALKQFHLQKASGPPDIWIKLSDASNNWNQVQEHKLCQSSMHGLLTMNIPIDTAAACLHLLYEARKFVATMP
ncbi:TPA: hypothetical protein ACH3X1_012057 [Trebouxia sp. C0004]